MRRIAVLVVAVFLLAASGAVAADSLCFDEAGAKYGINPLILRAIAKVESNFNPRAINWNRNGSYDFGVMQINSSWGYTLGREWWSTLGDPCTNIKAGAMILSACMDKYGYTWEAIGCYNSRTPDKRDRYAMMVYKQLQRIERDDRQLKKGLEAAVQNRIEDWVKASQNGQGDTFKLTVPAPKTPDAAAPPLELPALSAAEKGAAAPGEELTTASRSEGGSNGM
jgi:hypothetical protein